MSFQPQSFIQHPVLLRSVFLLTITAMLSSAGCSRQENSGPVTSTSSTPTTMPTQPDSNQVPAIPPRDIASNSETSAGIAGDIDEEISGVVRSILEDQRGILWLGAEGGLFSYDGKTLSDWHIKDEFGKGVTVKGIVTDNKGNVWCGFHGGIAKYDGTSFRTWYEEDGLLSRDVWSIASDSSGTIWIGTIAGVCHFDGKTFETFTLPESKPDPTRGVTSAQIVHCIMVDSKDSVWFGTNGGAYIYDGTNLAHLSEADGLSNNVVYKLHEDKSGNIWFGTTHGGLSRYDGKRFTNFTKDGIVDGTEIWCVSEDSSGNIWFSGKGIGAYRYNGDSFVNYNEQHGLTSPGIMCIHEDREKRLWLGGTHGLFRFQEGAIVKVTRSGPWN